MANRQADQRRNRRNREHQRLQETFAMFARNGPYIKRILNRRGFVFPFYDFYDSYVTEYERAVAESLREFPSLIDVSEVSDESYYSPDHSHTPPGMEQIIWQSPGEANGYGLNSAGDANVNGVTCAFHDSGGQLKTRIFIRQRVPNSKPHREFKYIMKLMALLHELGHVRDMESGINFEHATKRCNMIEAEVYAQLYSLERMSRMNYFQCFEMLVQALKDGVTANTYFSEVAKLTLDRMPTYSMTDVNSIPLLPLSEEDIQAIGADGVRVLNGK